MIEQPEPAEPKSTKEAPKTITVDVDEQSWAGGYDAASKDCTYYNQPPAQQYLGRTLQQWEKLAFDLIPLLIFIVIFLAFFNVAIKKQRAAYKKMNDDAVLRIEKSIENQLKAIEEQKKTNNLLQQLLEKMDK